MGFSGLELCLSAEPDWTGHFLVWKQILILFCVMCMLLFSPFFSYCFLEQAEPFQGLLVRLTSSAANGGSDQTLYVSGVCTDDETWCSILWASLRHRSGLPPGRPGLCEEQQAVAAPAAPRTQSNLVMSGWHGAKLVIGKVFISLGQVLPTEIHCFWKCSQQHCSVWPCQLGPGLDWGPPLSSCGGYWRSTVSICMWQGPWWAHLLEALMSPGMAIFPCTMQWRDTAVAERLGVCSEGCLSDGSQTTHAKTEVSVMRPPVTKVMERGIWQFASWVNHSSVPQLPHL